MNITDLLLATRAEGIEIERIGDGIKLSGGNAAVSRWRGTIAEHKAHILEHLKVGAGETVTANQEPFDRETFEERAAICEFDGGLSREAAEAIAWFEDDRRRCMHCLNLLPNGVCKAGSPTGLVVARKGYTPVVDLPRRCEGYQPCPADPDRRGGMERWSGLFQKGGK